MLFLRQNTARKMFPIRRSTQLNKLVARRPAFVCPLSLLFLQPHASTLSSTLKEVCSIYTVYKTKYLGKCFPQPDPTNRPLGLQLLHALSLPSLFATTCVDVPNLQHSLTLECSLSHACNNGDSLDACAPLAKLFFNYTVQRRHS